MAFAMRRVIATLTYQVDIQTPGKKTTPTSDIANLHALALVANAAIINAKLTR